MPEPWMVTSQEFGVSGPSKKPATTWLEFIVTLTKIITKMDVREISLVSRPAGVTTRLLVISVDNADLIEALGPDFEVGMPVSCDKCLNGCWGISEFDLPDASLAGDEPQQEVA